MVTGRHPAHPRPPHRQLFSPAQLELSDPGALANPPDHVDASRGDDSVYGFDVGIDCPDLGGADYDMTRTDDGLLVPLGDSSSMLLSGVFDLE